MICNCCKPEKLKPCPAQPKTDCHTQTCHSTQNVGHCTAQTSKCPIRICGTQTLPKKEHKKKRHVTVVCCHCCQCECNCQKNGGGCTAAGDEKPKIVCSSLSSPRSAKAGKDGVNSTRTSALKENTRFPDFKHRGTDFFPVEAESNDWAKSLDRYRPWDTMFSNKKHPWLLGTSSDIYDQRCRHKIDEQFASPVSGRIYKLSPVKIDNSQNDYPANFPDPIDVNKDLEYLDQLENKLKTDLNFRDMLDKICDAILYNHKPDTKEIF